MGPVEGEELCSNYKMEVWKYARLLFVYMSAQKVIKYEVYI